MKNIHLAVKNPRIISHAFSWFEPAIILLSLVLLLSAGAAPVTNVYTIDVPCTVPWTDTGINIGPAPSSTSPRQVPCTIATRRTKCAMLTAEIIRDNNSFLI